MPDSPPSVPDELVEVTARALAAGNAEGWRFDRYPKVRESYRFDARAVLSAVSEAGWVRTEEADRWREAWKARGRQINGVGEFADEGPWWPPEERSKVCAERDAARARADKLAEALSFYADESQWINRSEIRAFPGYHGRTVADRALRAYREDA